MSEWKMGILPEGWDHKPLSEVFFVSSGEGLSQARMRPGTFPVYGGNGVTGFHDAYLYEEPQLIIGRVGEYCGNAYITDSRSWVTDNALVTKFHIRSPDLRFWCYLLNHTGLNDFAFAAAQPVITSGILKRISVPIPPLPQQFKIAKILTTVDNLIEKTEALIAKYQAVKQGMMHDLFTRGVDEHGHLRPPYDEAPELYKESELGWIPKEWDVHPVGDYVTDWAVGPRFSGELYAEDGNVATLRTTDMDDEGALSMVTMPLARLNLTAFRLHLLQPGDLVISRSGTCGVTAIFPGYDVPVLPGAFLIRFRFSTAMEPDFLKRLFNSPRGRETLLHQAEGGVQKNIRGTSILRVKLAAPPVVEQRQIICCFTSVDLLIQREVGYSRNLQVTKTGLMQDLLTGKVRVKVDGDAEDV